MNIETHSIDFLKTHIPDLDWLLNTSLVQHLCSECNAYVAGGSLRRAMRRKSIADVFNKEKVWARFTLDIYNKNKNIWNVKDPDVDFFIVSLKDYGKARNSLGKNPHVKLHKTSMYASSYFYDDGKKRFRFQLVEPSFVSEKSTRKINNIIDILGTFDFYNCQVATNLKECFINDELIELEKNRILKISKEQSAERRFIFQRAHKYLTQEGGYKRVENRNILLKTFQEYVNKSICEPLMTNHLSNPILFPRDELVLYYRPGLKEHNFQKTNKKIIKEIKKTEKERLERLKRIQTIHITTAKYKLIYKQLQEQNDKKKTAYNAVTRKYI
tara:strand:- start:201 stop:1184 length:984 start_codon:yes stop_codon:yes gene_type:complete